MTKTEAYKLVKDSLSKAVKDDTCLEWAMYIVLNDLVVRLFALETALGTAFPQTVEMAREFSKTSE
jgi:hypothetical protein